MLDVSVVIPHYNNHEQIVRAYSSVMAQSILPREIIIVDDASINISYLDKIKVNHVSDVKLNIIYLEKNGGPSKARNYAVLASEASYIAFLDADDVWHPQKLELIFNILLSNKNINFIFHGYSFYPLEKISYFQDYSINLTKIKKNKFVFKNYIFTPSVILKKEFFEPFPEETSFSEDFVCWFLSNQDDFFYFVDLPLANGFKKPIGEAGLSSNVYKMHHGFLDALKYLKSIKKISRSFYITAVIIEYIKYPLRYLR